MNEIKRIQVSSIKEAIEQARTIFEYDQACDWIIAEGQATVGGALFGISGDLLMHRSEHCVYTDNKSIEHDKARILAKISR